MLCERALLLDVVSKLYERSTLGLRVASKEAGEHFLEACVAPRVLVQCFLNAASRAAPCVCYAAVCERSSGAVSGVSWIPRNGGVSDTGRRVEYFAVSYEYPAMAPCKILQYLAV